MAEYDFQDYSCQALFMTEGHSPISSVTAGIYRTIPGGYAQPVPFADNIRSARLRLQLNQTEFGKQLGKGQSAVSKWERGLAVPSTTELREIAGRLGTTADALMEGEPTPTASTIAPTPLTALERRALKLFRLASDKGQAEGVRLLASVARAFPRRPGPKSDEQRGRTGRVTERRGHGTR